MDAAERPAAGTGRACPGARRDARRPGCRPGGHQHARGGCDGGGGAPRGWVGARPAERGRAATMTQCGCSHNSPCGPMPTPASSTLAPIRRLRESRRSVHAHLNASCTPTLPCGVTSHPHGDTHAALRFSAAHSDASQTGAAPLLAASQMQTTGTPSYSSRARGGETIRRRVLAWLSARKTVF